MTIKKYKFALISLGSYIIAFSWFMFWVLFAENLVNPSESAQFSDILNNSILAVLFAIILLGVFFGLKSNKSKESAWLGNLLAATGIACIFYFLLMMAGLMVG